MEPERLPLEEMTLRQLRRVASQYNISRYSRMRKDQLLASVAKAMQNQIVMPKSIIQEEQKVEAAKFDLGQEDPQEVTFASVDEGIGELPGGYGESRIVLMPRDPQWAYAYWDIPNIQKEELRRQGGQQLSLRLYDVTDLDGHQSPHSVQEYLCDEMAREWYLPVPVSDRDYIIDIGYRCPDGRYLVLSRSSAVRIPPVYPSDWVEDVFITVNWEEELRDQTFYQLVPPNKRQPVVSSTTTTETGFDNTTPIYDQIFAMAQGTESQRIAGSLYGSMQHLPIPVSPQDVISSYVFPSGVGLWAMPTVSGLSMSGVGLTASGIGLGGSEQLGVRPRKFWLVADAELIVYGATEPDATVTIGGHPIKLNSDGTFRFQMSFQDGLIDYPIMAVAIDGEQTRSIHMKFNRETPSRRTNTKEEAVLEWLP